jgi:SAM-dependent methyltransferase
VIDEFAGEFWSRRAEETQGSIRWTDDRMLCQDLELIDAVLPEDGGALLDLGCGTGDLFIPFLDQLDSVTAVDMVPEFIARLPRHPKVHGIVSPVVSFEPQAQYDVGLLFGVVQYLEPADEPTVYRLLRRAVRKGGVVIVKSQCARGEGDLVVDGYSETFGQRYVSRYPAMRRQRDTLASIFDDVTVLRYPEELSPWPDTEHVAFVCR